MRFSATFLALALAIPVATVSIAPPAVAQDDLLDEEVPASDAEAAPTADSSQPTTVAATDTSVGGATGFVFKTGLYLTSELGGFIRFGGYGDSAVDNCLRCVNKISSNLQPWIALTIGYDFLKFLGAEVTLGTGFIAEAGPIPNEGNSPENSAVTMLNVAVTGSYYIDRFALTGKGFVGGALLTPGPFPDAVPVGGQAGVSFGVRYATLLTNVVIGLDVATYLIFSPDVATADIGPVALGSGIPIIPALSFGPVIKYTF